MASSSISHLARAKINLDLLITGQRGDGYHLLDSLVVFADYGDEIFVRPSQELILNVTGPFAGGLRSEGDNIILKTARLLQDKFDIRQGAEIELVKNLPVSSGIGGGSADAAAAIHALMTLWNITDKISTLTDLALSLGADVPVCLDAKTTHMCGIGERLRPITFKFPLFLLLVNPAISVSTADIFRARADHKADFSAARILHDEITTLDQLKYILGESGNDLEHDACMAAPVISRVLEEITKSKDCIAAGMSGSGATCFGIYLSIDVAHRQAVNISREFPDWWVKPVKVR